MRERLQATIARTICPWDCPATFCECSPGSRQFERADELLAALARALREDEEAVEAMQDPLRIGDARGKLAKLCDYLEKPDA